MPGRVRVMASAWVLARVEMVDQINVFGRGSLATWLNTRNIASMAGMKGSYSKSPFR